MQEKFNAMDGARVVQKLIEEGPFGRVSVLSGLAYPEDEISLENSVNKNDKAICMKLIVTQPAKGKTAWAMRDVAKIKRRVSELVVKSGGDMTLIKFEMQATYY